MTKMVPCVAARRLCMCVSLCIGSWFAATGPLAHAQGQRDPTVPPASAVGGPLPGASARAQAPDTGPVAVIVRDGKPYLVVGTRLYAQGQVLGTARVERITETEVWLREGKTLHKKPIFAGIVRTTAGGTPPPPSECVVPAGKTPVARRQKPATAPRQKADREPPGVNCRP